MCGLVALFSNPPRTDMAVCIDRLLRPVRHRGPDGQGVVCGCGRQRVVGPEEPADWGLGHVRLAILDLSPAGRQPMATPDGRLWVTYNGEVYNYVELAEELARGGATFRTRTDTEVLLAAYRAWGPRCTERFVGMFAFVLVDLDRGIALAARDRLGIKPLYFWHGPHETLIVSEPKQLIAWPDFRPMADARQIVDYLSEGLLGHDPARSCFAGVRPLPPGHTLTWSLDQQPKLEGARSYWSPAIQTRRQSWDEAVARTAELVRSAVRLHLRSDVPVGVALSGGIDSSSILGLACHDMGKPLATFSISNPDGPVSERPYIDAVNRHWGCPSHVQPLVVDRVLEDFDQWIYSQDEPVYSLSQYAEYALMRLARPHGITVMLSGQGGDEALCGYRKYAYFYLRHLYRQRRYGRALQHVYQSLRHGDRQLFQFWQGLRYAPRWLRRRYDPLDRLLRPTWLSLRRAAWKSEMNGVVDVHEHQLADLRRWSLPVLLRYQDRNSMAHQIEARVPLVDHRLLEHALTLPEEFFFRRGMTKRLLVEAVGSVLPDAVRQRRTKLGFDTPQQTWLRGTLGARLEQRARTSQRLDQIMDVRAAGQAFQAYREGKGSIPHFLLFRIACLAAWLERFQVDVVIEPVEVHG